MFLALTGRTGDYARDVYDLLGEFIVPSKNQYLIIGDSNTFEVKGKEFFRLETREESLEHLKKMSCNVLIGVDNSVHYSLGKGYVGYVGELRHGGRIDHFTPQRLYNICVCGNHARNKFLSQYNGKISFAGFNREGDVYLWAGTDKGKNTPLYLVSTRLGVFSTDSPLLVDYLLKKEEENETQVMALPINKLVVFNGGNIKDQYSINRD